MELIACNFFEVMPECGWLQHSRDQKGGNRFWFFTKIVTGETSQKAPKEKPHAEAI